MKGTHYNHGFGGFITRQASDSPAMGGFDAPMVSGATQPGSGTVRGSEAGGMASSPVAAATQATGSRAAARPAAMASPTPNLGTLTSPSVPASGNRMGMGRSPNDTSTMSMATPKDQTVRAGTRARAGSPTQTVQLAAARFRGSQQAVGPRQAENAPFDYSPDSKVARTNLGY